MPGIPEAPGTYRTATQPYAAVITHLYLNPISEKRDTTGHFVIYRDRTEHQREIKRSETPEPGYRSLPDGSTLL